MNSKKFLMKACKLLVFQIETHPGLVERQPLDEIHTIVIERVKFFQIAAHHCTIKILRLDAELGLKTAELGLKLVHIYEQFA